MKYVPQEATQWSLSNTLYIRGTLQCPNLSLPDINSLEAAVYVTEALGIHTEADLRDTFDVLTATQKHGHTGVLRLCVSTVHSVNCFQSASNKHILQWKQTFC